MKKNEEKTHLLELYPLNNKKDIIVCVMTGSDGGINWSRQIAKMFNKNDIPSCAVAYWNYKKLPKKVSLIPVEIIEIAVNSIKKHGYRKVCLYGLSKGAELSLLSASLFKNIDGVIAVSPSCAIFEGYSLNGYSNHSAWTYQQQELPYISSRTRKFNLITMCFGYAFLQEFSTALSDGFSEANRIKVENAQCPILLISAENDSIWQSKTMSNMIMDKLQEVNYKYSYQHISFEKASHILCPVRSIKLKIFPQERKYPKECEQSRQKAFQLTIDWLNHI